MSVLGELGGGEENEEGKRWSSHILNSPAGGVKRECQRKTKKGNVSKEWEGKKIADVQKKVLHNRLDRGKEMSVGRTIRQREGRLIYNRKTHRENQTSYGRRIQKGIVEGKKTLFLIMGEAPSHGLVFS